MKPLYGIKEEHSLSWNKDVLYKNIDQCYSWYEFGDIQEIIHAIKFYKQRELLELFGDLSGDVRTLMGEYQKETTQITYVPLHWRAWMSRGANHTKILANILFQKTSFPITPLVKKTYLHSPLSQLGKSDRAKIISGSFISCGKPKPHIVLVDDIVTTGATSGEIARVLLEAGAQKISLLTLARVADPVK